MTILNEHPTAAAHMQQLGQPATGVDPVTESLARVVSYYRTPDYALYREGDMFRIGHPGAWLLADMNDIPNAILTLAALDARATGL